MLNKKYKLILLALTTVIYISGCGNTSDEEKELAVFSAAVSEFSEYIKEADEKINTLDTNKKESVDELLIILDDMDEKFFQFSQIYVPVQYSAIETLADKASEKMSSAVTCYHSAFEADEFDKLEADQAYLDYEFSMEMIEYIGCFLAGKEIPENEHITIYEETNDSHILNKWLSDDDVENETTSVSNTEVVN